MARRGKKRESGVEDEAECWRYIHSVTAVMKNGVKVPFWGGGGLGGGRGWGAKGDRRALPTPVEHVQLAVHDILGERRSPCEGRLSMDQVTRGEPHRGPVVVVGLHHNHGTDNLLACNPLAFS